MSADRVAELRAWCEQRIAQCRRDEHKFGAFSSIAYEAATERRTLSAVLDRLGYATPPVDHADLHGRDAGRLARDAELRAARGRKAAPT